MTWDELMELIDRFTSTRMLTVTELQLLANFKEYLEKEVDWTPITKEVNNVQTNSGGNGAGGAVFASYRLFNSLFWAYSNGIRGRKKDRPGMIKFKSSIFIF